MKHKAGFDDAMEDMLMADASEEQKKKHSEIKQKMSALARKRSDEEKLKSKLGKSLKRCAHRDCSNFISDKSRRCKIHAPRTLLALDFNNL